MFTCNMLIFVHVCIEIKILRAYVTLGSLEFFKYFSLNIITIVVCFTY
jgi:hypothetical protein